MWRFDRHKQSNRKAPTCEMIKHSRILSLYVVDHFTCMLDGAVSVRDPFTSYTVLFMRKNQQTTFNSSTKDFRDRAAKAPKKCFSTKVRSRVQPMNQNPVTVFA